MKTIIVIPTYNENLNIEKLIKEIFSFHPEISILIVDDASIDGTIETVTNLQNEFKNIYLLKRNTKLGLASAYVEGFKYALNLGFNSFIQMDGDFSHNPKYLKEMLDYLENNDVVIASRYVKNGGTLGWGLIRKLISKGGSLYSKIVLNCPINDLTGGFNAWTKESLAKIDLDKIISKGYCFQVEMKYKAYKAGLKIKEFPIIFEDRKFGKSKMSKEIFFEAIVNIFKLKFKK